jgi:hypothetical protein
MRRKNEVTKKMAVIVLALLSTGALLERRPKSTVSPTSRSAISSR